MNNRCRSLEPNWLTILQLKEDRANAIPQALKLARVVSKQFVPPGCVSLLTTIVGHCGTDAFIGAEFGLKGFRSAPNTENENSASQAFRYDSFRSLQPIFLTVKVHHKDQEAIGVTIHSRYVIRRKSFQHLLPTTR